MSGAVLGFEIAAGISLFLIALLVVIPRVAMPFRAWWYKRFEKGKELPPDVKKYLLKKGLKLLRKIKNASPEQQSQIAQAELLAALTAEPGELGEDPSALLSEAMSRLGQIPLEHCAVCSSPVFTHEAIKIDDKFYCANCGGRMSSS